MVELVGCCCWHVVGHFHAVESRASVSDILCMGYNIMILPGMVTVVVIAVVLGACQ